MCPSVNRTQVLLPEDVRERVRLLAAQRKRSMSAMCSELIEFALSNGNHYQAICDTNTDQNEALVHKLNLTEERVQKLLKLLEALE
jgi:plasmid stability protein